MKNLSAALRGVDDALSPLLAKSLAKPAAKKHLDALARDVFGDKLPAELREWFGWHDGQNRASPLDPANNFTAMSAKEVRATWRMLADPKQECLRPRAGWVPLFENGGGDFLMYATTGAKRGALFVYWHDDKDWPRSPAYRSLVDWAVRVAKAQTKLAATEARSSGFDLTKLRFEPIARAPALAALEAADVGTIFRRQNRPDSISLYLKATPDRWVWNWARRFDQVVEELEAEVRKLARSELACDARSVHRSLTERRRGESVSLSRALAPRA